MAETDPCCKGCNEELDGDQLCCDICGGHICSQCSEQCPCCGAEVCLFCMDVCQVCGRTLCDGCINKVNGLEFCVDCNGCPEVEAAKHAKEEERKLARWNADVAQVQPKPKARTGKAVVMR